LSGCDVSYIRDDRRRKASIGNRDGESAFRVTAEKGNPSVDEKKYYDEAGAAKSEEERGGGQRTLVED
jgi:hypothetical protein